MGTISPEGRRVQPEPKPVKATDRESIAKVASMLFGRHVLPENVIGETLRRSTERFDGGDPAQASALRDRLLARRASRCSVKVGSKVERIIDATM